VITYKENSDEQLKAINGMTIVIYNTKEHINYFMGSDVITTVKIKWVHKCKQSIIVAGIVAMG
jgi:hypothetical protein